jgi:hypothetical protein
MTDSEKLAIAIQALREIKTGSAITGRWIDQHTLEAIDDANDEDTVPDGYYDTQDPPKPDPFGAPEPAVPADLHDHENLLLVNGAWLTAASWEAYDEEEQDQWISSVAGIAGRALTAMGDTTP